MKILVLGIQHFPAFLSGNLLRKFSNKFTPMQNFRNFGLNAKPPRCLKRKHLELKDLGGCHLRNGGV